MARAVLFDLDGTLADTAPDLADALNLLRQRRGLPPLAQPVIRPHASHGARGLLHIGFGLDPEDEDFPALREALLDAYAANLCNRTRLFPGIDAVLRQLERRRIPWGVVTNKPARFTQPLIDRLGLAQRAATVISGDSCAHPKPHPEPMHCASREIGVPAPACLYIGDAQRDAEAALAAGMTAVIARYGYLGENDRPQDWRAHHLIDAPAEILGLLE